MSDLLAASEPENILAVSRLLRDGGVAIIPTDTVYGLAASIYQEGAVERVYAIKKRGVEKRVPILLATAADLPLLVEDIPHAAWILISLYWPGPLTLVLPADNMVPRWMLAGGRTVAVRVPFGQSCLQLLQSVGEPLVGTSANVAGQIPALTAAQAQVQLGSLVDAVLVDDDAPLQGAVSTVVEVTDAGVIVHRQGAIGVAELRDRLGLRVDLAP
jgi:L-threonylcarbamoyladenylate synthase